MLYQCKKLWGGRVSVRSYIVDYCKKMKEPLIVTFENKRMKIRNFRSFYCDGRTYTAEMTDKYIKKGETYKLYDFQWNPEVKHEEYYTMEGMSKMVKCWKKIKDGTQLPLDK